MKKLLLLVVAVFWVARAAASPGVSMSPNDVVKSAVQTVMAAAKADPAAKDGDIDATAKVVRRDFLPYADFAQTTRLSAGAAWQTMTAVQRKALVQQFTTLLVRTYALQLVQVRDEVVKFSFEPASVNAAGNDAVVRTEIKSGDGDNVQVAYRLVNTPAGWRIYDIDMMGIWLIKLYQPQLSTQFARSGADGLIKYITDHNARVEG
ncbi:MAG: ABC transporter substrate-binding protein [Burkholderiaceae bacterium]|nr:MAG: ABC transporter substrate-binding protein [Burkholderiaceae bacterium]